MERATAKRIGRPAKPPGRTIKRVSLGLKVSAQIKRQIDDAARQSGKTQSQEAEYLIEQGLAVKQALAAMSTTLSELARRSAEANFRSRGYRAKHSPHGDIWFPSGHPDAPPASAFIEQEDNK